MQGNCKFLEISLVINWKDIIFIGSIATSNTFKKLIMRTNLFVICIFLIQNVYSQWHQTNGPRAGYYTCIDAHNNMVVVGSYGEGVLFSSDNGQNWNSISNQLTKSFVSSALIIENQIYASFLNFGLAKSLDFGKTWTLINNGLDSLNTRLFHGIGNDIIALNKDGMFRSKNGGSDWELITVVNEPVSFIYVDGSDLFMLTAVGIFHSIDGGDHWEWRNKEFKTATCMTRNGAQLFAGSKNSIYTSSNNGLSWNQIFNYKVSDELLIKSIQVYNSSTIACTNRGIIKSDDQGVNWYSANQGLNWLGCTMLIAHNNELLVTTYGSIFSSSDGANNWKSVIKTSNYVQSKNLKFDGLNLFAGTDYGLFVSNDLGASWTTLHNNLQLSFFGPNIRDFEIINNSYYTATKYGLFKSTDQGKSWIQKNDGLFSIYKNQPEFYNIAYFDSTIYVGNPFGVYISKDDGETWFLRQQCLPSKESRQVMNIFKIDTNIIIGTNDGNYIFMDLPNSFDTCQRYNNNGLNDQIINTIKHGDNYIANSLYNGVFLSEDKGVSWRNISMDINSEFVKAIALYKNILFAATARKIYYTTDFGNTWIDFSQGMALSQIQSLEVAGNNLIAGGSDFFDDGTKAGVWIRSLDDLTETQATKFKMNHLTIFPNPNNGRFSIGIPDINSLQNVNLIIYNLMGNIIYSESSLSKVDELTLELNPGLYFISLRVNGKNSYTQKIVVQE